MAGQHQDGGRFDYLHVSPNLGFADFPSVAGHLLSGDKGLPDKNDTDSSDNSHSSRYYKHPEGPERHFRLGYKVALGSLIFIGRFYYILYAFRARVRIKAETAALNVLLDMAGVGAGIAFIPRYGYSVL